MTRKSRTPRASSAMRRSTRGGAEGMATITWSTGRWRGISGRSRVVPRIGRPRRVRALLVGIVVHEADHLDLLPPGGHQVLGQRHPRAARAHDEHALERGPRGAGRSREALAEHPPGDARRGQEDDREHPVDDQHAPRVGPVAGQDAEQAEDDDAGRGAVPDDGDEIGDASRRA